MNKTTKGYMAKDGKTFSRKADCRIHNYVCALIAEKTKNQGKKDNAVHS